MKFIITAMLALLTFTSAFAQTLVTPLLPCITDRPDLPLPVPTVPKGLPAQLTGACSPAIIEVNAEGAAAAYWCAQPAPTKAVLRMYAVRWSALSPAMAADYASLGLPGDNGERIRAMQAKYQTANIADMCDVWGPAIERINAAMPAPIVVLTWKVSPNAASTTTPMTRPSYAVIKGRRSLTSTTRVNVGAPCDMTQTFVEGSTTYARTSPGYVAVCSKW